MKTLFVTTDISDKLSQVLNSHADLNSKIVAQMHAGVAHFSFVKKDGSIREAYGSLNKDLLTIILGEQKEVEQSEPVPDSTAILQKYYDLEARSFRSFTIANLIALY